MNHEHPEPQHEAQGVPHGSRQPDRHEGRHYVPPHTEADPLNFQQGFPTGSPINGPAVPPELQIQLNHQQITQNFPDPETSEELRTRAPEVYQAWVRTTADTINTDNYVRRRAVDNPRKIAILGQVVGLVAVLAVFSLAGYAVHENQPWLAGFLCSVNVVMLAGAFTGNRAKDADDA